MKRLLAVALAAVCILPDGWAARKKQAEQPKSDREVWAETAYKIAYPVLSNLAAGTLHANMPIEQRGPSHPEYGAYGDRTKYAYLEALGRTICGIAPWLELPVDTTTRDGKMRKELLDLSIRGLRNAMDTTSADYISFAVGYQALVDAAHLAQGLRRAPKNLWGGLDEATRERIVYEMKQTRKVRPNVSNWLMFTAQIEAFLRSVGEEYDQVRVDYPVRQMNAWYKGDGVYGDGEPFHWDYYNSFVIQPMLIDVLGVMGDGFPGLRERVLKRAARYAEVTERMISPEGTIPPLGRSLQYRTAALQVLSQMALQDRLPKSLSKGQVRSAMTAVIRRFFEQPGTFDSNGWLRIGFCGAQPEIGEAYTCTGSLYLCLTGFLALGLPEDDPFWTAPGEPWTSRRAWSGEPFPQDHSIGD